MINKDLVIDAVPLCHEMESLSVISSSNVSSRLAVTNSSTNSPTTPINSYQPSFITRSTYDESCNRLIDERDSSIQDTARRDLSGSATAEPDSSRQDSELQDLCFHYNLLESEESELRWQSVNRHLQFNVEGLQHEDLWKKIALVLYGKIEAWERVAINDYVPPIWDFCVIHSKDEIDQEIVETFIKHLELEGLRGDSVSNFRVGEDKFEASERVLNGSTIIFALDSLPFSQSGFHRLQYQESMIKKIRFEEWKKKIIPLRLSKADQMRYKNKYPLLWYKSKGSSLFGLSSIRGIELGVRANTIAKVRQVLTIDHQEMNDEQRRRKKDLFKHAIALAKVSKCQNLKEGLIQLHNQFSRENYSPESLVRFCLECEDLPSFSSDADQNQSQLITLDNCTEISIGPAFHFNIQQPTNY